MNGFQKGGFGVLAACGADFGPEKGDLRQENIFYWDRSV
jgi:hypothetical protein